VAATTADLRRGGRTKKGVFQSGKIKKKVSFPERTERTQGNSRGNAVSAVIFPPLRLKERNHITQ